MHINTVKNKRIFIEKILKYPRYLQIGIAGFFNKIVTHKMLNLNKINLGVLKKA